MHFRRTCASTPTSKSSTSAADRVGIMISVALRKNQEGCQYSAVLNTLLTFVCDLWQASQAAIFRIALLTRIVRVEVMGLHRRQWVIGIAFNLGFSVSFIRDRLADPLEYIKPMYTGKAHIGELNRVWRHIRYINGQNTCKRACLWGSRDLRHLKVVVELYYEKIDQHHDHNVGNLSCITVVLKTQAMSVSILCSMAFRVI